MIQITSPKGRAYDLSVRFTDERTCVTVSMGGEYGGLCVCKESGIRYDVRVIGEAVSTLDDLVTNLGAFAPVVVNDKPFDCAEPMTEE